MSAVLDVATRAVSTRPRRRRPRVAEVASALAAAPIRYATRPVTAREIVRTTCAACSGGSRCCGSYTSLCCTLPGGDNFGCPPKTFIGGWWQCNYSGKKLCGTTNMRYYLDCSIKPGEKCPGGCHCGNDDCSNFKTCCVVFRYGNCNTDIGAITAIQCRLVTCVIPCRIDCLDCNCSSAVDQTTCKHDAGCL